MIINSETQCGILIVAYLFAASYAQLQYPSENWVEVFENEEWSFVQKLRWGIPSDGIVWRNRDVSPAIPPDDVSTPDGWEWSSPWKIDISGQRDNLGWEYAETMKGFTSNNVPRKKLMTDTARRRRWIRAMAPSNGVAFGSTPGPDAVGTSETTGSYRRKGADDSFIAVEPKYLAEMHTAKLMSKSWSPRSVGKYYGGRFRFLGIGIGIIKPLVNRAIGIGIRLPLTANFQNIERSFVIPRISSFFGLYFNPFAICFYLSFSYPVNTLIAVVEWLGRVMNTISPSSRTISVEKSPLPPQYTAAMSARGGGTLGNDGAAPSPPSLSSIGAATTTPPPTPRVHYRIGRRKFRRRYSSSQRGGLSVNFKYYPGRGLDIYVSPWLYFMPGLRMFHKAFDRAWYQMKDYLVLLAALYTTFLYSIGQKRTDKSNTFPMRPTGAPPLPARMRRRAARELPLGEGRREQHPRPDANTAAVLDSQIQAWGELVQSLHRYLSSKTTAIGWSLWYSDSPGGSFVLDILPFFAEAATNNNLDIPDFDAMPMPMPMPMSMPVPPSPADLGGSSGSSTGPGVAHPTGYVENTGAGSYSPIKGPGQQYPRGMEGRYGEQQQEEEQDQEQDQEQAQEQQQRGIFAQQYPSAGAAVNREEYTATPAVVSGPGPTVDSPPSPLPWTGARSGDGTGRAITGAIGGAMGGATGAVDVPLPPPPLPSSLCAFPSLSPPTVQRSFLGHREALVGQGDSTAREEEEETERTDGAAAGGDSGNNVRLDGAFLSAGQEDARQEVEEEVEVEDEAVRIEVVRKERENKEEGEEGEEGVEGDCAEPPPPPPLGETTTEAPAPAPALALSSVHFPIARGGCGGTGSRNGDTGGNIGGGSGFALTHLPHQRRSHHHRHYRRYHKASAQHPALAAEPVDGDVGGVVSPAPTPTPSGVQGVRAPPGVVRAATSKYVQYTAAALRERKQKRSMLLSAGGAATVPATATATATSTAPSTATVPVPVPVPASAVTDGGRGRTSGVDRSQRAAPSPAQDRNGTNGDGHGNGFGLDSAAPASAPAPSAVSPPRSITVGSRSFTIIASTTGAGSDRGVATAAGADGLLPQSIPSGVGGGWAAAVSDSASGNEGAAAVLVQPASTLLPANAAPMLAKAIGA